MTTTTTTAASSFSLFSGLCPVHIPASWVSDPGKVRWASKEGVQYIDFTPNGGKAFAFSLGGGKPFPGPVEHSQSIVNPNCSEINPAAITNWGDRETGGLYVEGYVTSQIFGTSAQVVDLVPPDADDGVKVFPPAELEGVRIDTSVPARYYHQGDSYGGCGFFYAFVRTLAGGVLEAHIGFDPRGWEEPYMHRNAKHEDYLAERPESRENPDKIWGKAEREMQSAGSDFDSSVFVA